jgi:hypothetical protein
MTAMSSIFLGPRYDHDDGVREHFFWGSTQTSVYLHIRSPHIFDVSQWYHFALSDGTPREEHSDLVRGMRDARAAWLRFNTPDSLLSQSSHDLRAALGTGDRYYEMFKMNDRRVATALYEEVQAGQLIFVPDREEMRACMKAIREERQRTSKAATFAPQKLAIDEQTRLDVSEKTNTLATESRSRTTYGNAQSFNYQPHALNDNAEQLASATRNPDYAAKMLGYDRTIFGEMIHAMKDANDLGGADNVIWHDNGDVYFNERWIDNMHNY